MGEVKIKSGNLFDGELEQGSFGPAAGQEYPTNNRVRTKKNGVLLDKGTYTVTCIGSTGGMGVYAYTTESLYVKDDSVTDWTSLPLTFTLSETRLVRFVFRKTKDAAISPSDISDIQLLEGTYTSETIPEYEPYFLNRPAHQITNGQWVDIPTHHYTNGRWQGELTSQSPLKFRADGEMLDWRIEGRTSENLFDVNGNIARESSGSIEISQDQIIITVTATWGRDYVIFDKIFEPGLYIIKIISSSDTSGASYSIGCLSTTPLIGWTYNDYYAAYVKEFDNTLIIKITDSTRIGFRCSSSQVGQKVTLSNITLHDIGDWDETVEGNNLFDGEWKQGTIMSPSSLTRVSNKNVISLKPNAVYTLGLRGSSIIQYALVYRDKDGNVTYDSGWLSTEIPVLSPISEGATAEILLRRSDAGSISPVSEEVLSLKAIFVEGAYPPYEPYGGVGNWDETTQRYKIPVTVNGVTTNLYTDHQLMDGDSLDFTTDQTTIPITQGDNTLTVGTAVQPNKVFVKFEG